MWSDIQKIIIRKLKDRDFEIKGRLPGNLILTKYMTWFTFLKLNSWSLGAGFIPIICPKGINQIMKGNCKKKT